MRNFQRLVFIAFIFCVGIAKANLTDYLSTSDKRYGSFKLALDLIIQRNLKVLVETGTSRNGDKNCMGDGCSTMIYSDFLKDNEGSLYSVDISLENLIDAENALKFAKDNVTFIHSDSLLFLRDFPEKIDFLYLDSYDFDAGNPNPSQLHHLKEIMIAYNKLHDNSVVMIDDCGLIHGGKGTLAIQFLKSKGWKIIYDGYQVIMVKR